MRCASGFAIAASLAPGLSHAGNLSVQCIIACECVSVRACVRGCVRTCVRACVHVRACMRACVRACVTRVRDACVTRA